MKYAEVAVDAPGSHRHAFTYSIPVSLDVCVGQYVSVPLGARVVRGIVIALSAESVVPDTREIRDCIYPSEVIPPERVKLAQWIAGHYVSSLFSALALMLPPGFESGRQLKPKLVKYLELRCDASSLLPDALAKGKAPKQASVLETLSASGGMMPLAVVLRSVGCGYSVVDALVAKGLVELREVPAGLPARTLPDLTLEFPFPFTHHQLLAWQPLMDTIAENAAGRRSKPILLHGVTGSGKTEIYLQALAASINLGKKAICLVPEIALTPQMVSRFNARFPGRVARMHSGMSMTEKNEEWRRIVRGEYDVVIGPRSAIFAPQPDLGLIIVDEEHEQAYKESGRMPRYNARDVAVHLAAITGSVLILGSATPDVESYYRAQRNGYRLLELKERTSWQAYPSLPSVNIVNMRRELTAGERGIFSRLLRRQVSRALDKREQVILHINRRGSAVFCECSACGYVLGCRKCSGTLTYHSSEKCLVCHHCRRTYPLPTSCPTCRVGEIAYRGVGTEKVVEECKRFFPGARVMRFDSDALSGEAEYRRSVERFRDKKADILVGTQLLARGLDFPGVALVGVVNADTGLNLPDFRSGERTFQLLCQVAGRAGRGLVPGSAVIQTYNPDYYAIRYAAAQDYKGFYRREIAYRREFGYPPVSKMARLVCRHRNKEKCLWKAQKMSDALKQVIASKGLQGYRLIGPAPAWVSRLRGMYQMQLIVLGHEIQYLLNSLDLPEGWIVDVDPVGMI
jgi:primosomal protein N' (replication factor Y)